MALNTAALVSALAAGLAGYMFLLRRHRRLESAEEQDALLLYMLALVACAVAAKPYRVPPAPRRLWSRYFLGRGLGERREGRWRGIVQDDWRRQEQFPGQYDDLLDRAYVEAFRVDRGTFYFLLEGYGHLWTKQDTKLRKAVSPTHRLAIYLDWMATGTAERKLQEDWCVSDSTVSNIIQEMTQIFRWYGGWWSWSVLLRVVLRGGCVAALRVVLPCAWCCVGAACRYAAAECGCGVVAADL